MVPYEVWSRVIQFTGEAQRPGTAFLVGSGDDQLLTTAKHLCNDEPEEVAYLRHPWTNDGFAYRVTLVRVGRDVAPKADFAVFRLQKAIEVGGDLPMASPGDSFITQGAFILGYPYGWSSSAAGSIQQLPIVKSCIIAGMSVRDDVDTFYVDTIVNPGFSGGPLVFTDLNANRVKFGGVVTKGMTAPIREPTPKEPSPPEGPAGIGIVVRSQSFRDALAADAR
jgi:S1-C subfamily serine protease